ncbi:hypothetical protein [Methylococcus mesophilus]|uniref:hypothetical protein n=1 Tax=Methylococcus mesophilus TaxID=2993564 RepID=UPI00224AD934|nr:hypothetical protein [Methylococcus mesophilus]UZR27787.1 hypothetical protein OOT43_13775 [Methylococcus mesophilus]
MAEEITLSLDEKTGEYTRLTRFFPCAETQAFGGKRHASPEETFIVNGRLYDEAFGIWLQPGYCASRPRRNARAVPDGRGLLGVGGLVSQSNRVGNRTSEVAPVADL